MRFHLSAEQEAMQQSVRNTLRKVWSVAQMHEFADLLDDLHRPSWDALCALGIAGLAANGDDEEAGTGMLEAALVCEMIGEAAAPGPFVAQIVTAAAVALSENREARLRLDRIVSGKAVATLLAGSDLAQSATAADVFLIDDGADGLWLVEAGDDVATEPVPSTDRTRKLARVRISPTAERMTLFKVGDPMIERLRDAALVLIAADALGGAERVLDMSVAYAKERVQFGQPIGRFQGLKHQLADMALEVESARALVWYAAYAWDAALPDASRIAALAKAHLCEIYVRATRGAIAAHGGVGYTWEHGLHYWFRRAIMNYPWLDTPETLRSRAAELADWSA
jgi:alkylation response protein AidB-like acyl-CoA dehydrogenase